MAERIKMSPHEIFDAATYLRQRLEAITAEVNALNNKIEDVSSRWEGAARESYITRYQVDLKPVLTQTLPDVINALAKKLDVAADAIQQTDQQIAQAFSN